MLDDGSLKCWGILCLCSPCRFRCLAWHGLSNCMHVLEHGREQGREGGRMQNRRGKERWHGLSNCMHVRVHACTLVWCGLCVFSQVLCTRLHVCIRTCTCAVSYVCIRTCTCAVSYTYAYVHALVLSATRMHTYMHLCCQISALQVLTHMYTYMYLCCGLSVCIQVL